MACKLKDLKKDALNEAMRVFKGNANTISVSPYESDVLHVKPSSESKKIKDMKTATAMVSSNLTRVKKWASEKFGDNYSKGWAFVEPVLGTDRIRVKFSFPQILENSYIVKHIKEDNLDLLEGYDEVITNNRLMERFSPKYQQKTSSGQSVDKTINDKLVQQLSQYGITVNHVENLKDQLNNDIVAVADMMDKIISISKGKEAIDTLPEEAFHFFVEMLPDSNVLKNKLLNDIFETDLYSRVYEEYSTDPEYIKDGLPDTDKIRKEALGKALAQAYIKDELSEAPTSFWRTLKRFMDKILSIFKKVKQDTFQQEIIKLKDQITSGKAELDINNISYGKYYQKSNTVSETAKRIQEHQSEVEFNKDTHTYYYKGIEIAKSSSQVVHEEYPFESDDEAVNLAMKRLGVQEKTPEVYALAEEILEGWNLGREIGTDIHSIGEDVINGIDIDYSKFDNPKAVEKFVMFVQNIKDKTEENGGQVFTEVKIVDPGANTAGMIDMLTIDSDGTVTIYDYKTSKNSVKNRYYKGKQHALQLNLYKNMLKNSLSIDVHELKIVPIHLNIDYANNKLRAFEVEPIKNISRMGVNVKAEVKAEKYIPVINKTPVSKTNNQKKTDLLMKSIKVLRTRQKTLENKSRVDKAQELKNTKELVEKALDKRETELGIRLYLGQVEKDVANLKAVIQKYKEAPDSESRDKIIKLTSSNIAELSDFVDYYEKTTNDIKNTIEQEPELAKEFEELIEPLKIITGDISYISAFRDSIELDAIIKTAEKYDETGKLGAQLTQITRDDLNMVRLWAGSLKNANDQALRIIHSIIVNSKNQTEAYTRDLGREVFTLQENAEKAGFKDFSLFYERDDRGKKTGKLVTAYNMTAYREALTNHKFQVATALKLGNYADLDLDILTVEEKATFESMWNDFNSEHKNGDKPADKYLNDAYKKIKAHPEAFAYYQKLIEVKEEADKMLPKKYHTRYSKTSMPMIRKTNFDRITSAGRRDAWKNIKEAISEGVSLKEDEFEYGAREVFTDVNGREIKLVPIYYTNQLSNMDNLSDDLSMLYIKYANMAKNFESMTKALPDLELFQKAIAKRQYISGEHVKEGIETNVYKAVQLFMDTHLFGKRKNIEKDVNIPFTNKSINFGKLMDRWNSYVQRNNLVFSPFAALAGGLTGAINSKIEDIAGQYTDQRAKILAEKEFDTNLLQVLSQVGNRKQTNKMHQFFETIELFDDNSELFSDLQKKSKMGHILNRHLFFGSYRVLGDYRVKGKLALAVAYNMRYYEGEFLTKSKFNSLNKNMEPKERTALWKSLEGQSLYDAYTTVDGELVIKDEWKNKVTQEDLSLLKNRIKHLADRIDGVVSPIDKGAIHRNSLGRAVMMHRGWIPTGFDVRWKKKNFNYYTQEMEEGYWRTTPKVFKNMIMSAVNDKRTLLSQWNNLEDYEKANVKRWMGDLAYAIGISLIAAMLNNLADDDEDNWELQFSAYMASRTMLEVKAFWNPMEAIELLNSPAAGINHLESLTNIAKLADPDPIERGMYKGKTQAEKLMIKRSFLRHFYETQFPKDKNKWMESKAKDGLFYRLFRDKKD